VVLNKSIILVSPTIPFDRFRFFLPYFILL
jgi:hypothetical protein